jgi:glycosyltransferase involved in cell wall biosynthesis
MRLAILSSHPIQYQAPLFRTLSTRPGVELTALFCHDHGVRPTFDPGFGRTIQYDTPLLEGYAYRFLRNVAPRPSISTTGLINLEISRVLWSGEFDAVIVHGYNTVTSALALASPRRATKLLFRGESNLSLRRSFATRATKQVFLRSLFSHADHFLSIGSLNSAYLEAYGVSPSRITLAPYSVDNDFFATRSWGARASPGAARERLGLPDCGPLFLVSAKLVPKKRPLDALNAFARAGIAGRAGLVFVGDGELRQELNARIEALGVSSSVRVLGFRNQTELPEIYGATDVLVLPSDLETWGLVVNEAMACGAAAIVTDQVGAGPDLVGDPKCIFPAGNVEKLAAIMREIVTRREWLAHMKADAGVRIARWGMAQTADGVLRGVEKALCGVSLV